MVFERLRAGTLATVFAGLFAAALLKGNSGSTITNSNYIPSTSYSQKTEMSKYGFRYVALDMIELENGYDAQGIGKSNDGHFQRIEVLTDQDFNYPVHRNRAVLMPQDPMFSELEGKILKANSLHWK